MNSAMRFVVCSSSCRVEAWRASEMMLAASSTKGSRNLAIFAEGLGNRRGSVVGRIVCGFCSKDVGLLGSRTRKRRFLHSGTDPASVSIIDNCTGHRAEQDGGKCNAVIDQGNISSDFSSGGEIWNSFLDFFRVVVQQEDASSLLSPTEDLTQNLTQNELPLLQVCPATVPAPEDIDSADEVLSQLLYAGFGKISSTLDGFFSVIFPKLTEASSRSNRMELTTKLEPHAELCAPSARCVTAEEFSGSVEAFYAWLKARLPEGGKQLDLWGTAPGSKRVANLWRELLEGEISLEDSTPPKRTVHVASVQIRNEVGQMLVEAYQEMADGRIRPRNRPLSEKMRPGESVEEACLRGISEELGCQMGARDRVVLRHETYHRQEEERESFSYPGLLTRYVIHTITAHVKQLPSTDFNTEEDEDGNGAAVLVSASKQSSGNLGNAVGVRKHFWKWVQTP